MIGQGVGDRLARVHAVEPQRHQGRGFEHAAVGRCRGNRDAKADDPLQEQRRLEGDRQAEGTKADRERRRILDPEHQRPEDDAREAAGTLEHREPFHDPIRESHHAVRRAVRQRAPRDALDQDQEETWPIRDEQRNRQQQPEQHRC